MSDQSQKTVEVIARSRYETPHLTIYGTLAALTQKNQAGAADDNGAGKSTS